MVPKKALEMAADYFLQLENFSPNQVFENKLALALSGAPFGDSRDGKLAAMARPFVDAVAEPTATPGGGCVAAFAGAMAAGLGQMVAGLSRKKGFRAHYVDKLSEHLDALRREAEALTDAIDKDAASYDAVMAAFKLPQGVETEIAKRDEQIQRTTIGAAEIPLKVAERAVALFERLRQLEAIAAASMKSDLKVARLMASAGAEGALANVEINLDSIKDAAYVAAKRHTIAGLRDKLKATPVA